MFKKISKLIALTVFLACVFNLIFWPVIALIVGEFHSVYGNDGILAFAPFDPEAYGADKTIRLYLSVLWIVAAAQACAFSLPAPGRIETCDAAPLLPRLFSAAFVGGMVIAVPFMALCDIGSYFGLHAQYLIKGETAIYWGAAVWCVSWLFWIPFLLYRGRKEADFVERFVSRSVKGTTVGLALCVPWYYVLRRKDSCSCGFATFWALVVGVWSLMVLGGPLMFVFARDRRIRASLR